MLLLLLLIRQNVLATSIGIDSCSKSGIEWQVVRVNKIGILQLNLRIILSKTDQEIFSIHPEINLSQTVQVVCKVYLVSH